MNTITILLQTAQEIPMSDYCFISYSAADGLDFARKLANKLEGSTPNIPVWFDKDKLKPGRDWDIQIDEAIKSCKLLLFVMTKDSTSEKSVCKLEYTRGLSYKKPIIPLWLHREIIIPFRIGDRQRIDFRNNFDAGLAQLRDYLEWLDSPKGKLQTLKDRLLDAERDIQRVGEEDKPRIQSDIDDLKIQINLQEEIVKNPKAAEEQTEKNIRAGLKRERQTEKRVTPKTSTKFINPPPSIAPAYFQDRYFETVEIVKFLKDDAQRLMTIVGRGGVGKTVMVCRLLKSIETGTLPYNLGNMKIDGIIYLSENSNHKVNFPNIFADLSKLLLPEPANNLNAYYKDPQTTVERKMNALLEHFQGERVLLLLDNFESVINPQTQEITDSELDEALHALIGGPHHMVNAIITTRIAPRELNLFEPGRQRVLILDEGLKFPHAENILREMDEDGKLGLKARKESDPLLQRARKKTRGFPRALEALFAILSSDRYTTLEELLEMPLPENIIQALVGEAFNRLDSNAQKVIQTLAVYNRPVTSAAVDYLLQPHIPEINSAKVLNRLANMHFVRRTGGRYHLHQVDRDYAFGRISKELMELPSMREMTEDPTGEERTAQQVQPEPVSNTFTQHDLLKRAADYFYHARKPRGEWKTLDDIAAQQAEFDLRCASGDYDAAARVMSEIGFDYLLLWGHYRLMLDMYGKLHGKIKDTWLRNKSAGDLGSTYFSTGEISKAISCYTEALEITRETKNRQHEAVWLGNIGNAYNAIGSTQAALEFYEQALFLDRETGNRGGEGIRLSNIGNCYAELGDTSTAIKYHEQALDIFRETGSKSSESVVLENLGHEFSVLDVYTKAEENYQQTIQIADNISLPMVQLNARWGLARVYLIQNELDKAYSTIVDALRYDVPTFNHNANVLHGIIALRQGDTNTAQQAFKHSIEQASEILAKTPEYYEALDAKGLALCGLALCRSRLQHDPIDGEDSSHSKRDLHQAIETFRAARVIAPHAGVVKAILRLFDGLAKCDLEGLLEGVRAAVEGVYE